MRKTSQDAGDCMSITSGLDFDVKKPGAGILKTKKTSIKRKVQTFSLESDDGVAEPLIQKEKTESGNQSAKFLSSKTKTDSTIEKGNEKAKLLADNKTGIPSITSVPGITDNQVFANGIKDTQMAKSYASAAPIHNHMHTNVSVSLAEVINVSTPKSQILVEIEGNKQKNHSPSPLIFTTAKIHIDGKTKALEPVHVTTVPILSTVEGSAVKAGVAKEKSQAKEILGSFKSDNVAVNNPKHDETTTTTSSKDHITPANSISSVSVTFYSEILNKGTPLDKKLEKSSTYQSPVVTELKTFKISSNQDKTVDNTMKPVDKILEEAMQPKSAADSTTKESIKGFSTATETKPASTTSTVTPAVVSISRTHSTSPSLSQPSISSNKKDVEIDINKNIQALTCNKIESAKTVGISVSGNSLGKGNVARTTSNSIGNKQLQRQQNAKMDDKEVLNSSKISSNKSQDLVDELGSLNASTHFKDEGTSLSPTTVSSSDLISNNVVSSAQIAVSQNTSKSANGMKVSMTTSKPTNQVVGKINIKPTKISAPSVKTTPLLITTSNNQDFMKTESRVESNIMKTLATGSSKLPTKSTASSVKLPTMSTTVTNISTMKSNSVTSACKTETVPSLKSKGEPSLAKIGSNIPNTSSSAKTTETIKSPIAKSLPLASNIPLSTGTAASVIKTSTSVTVTSTAATVSQTASSINAATSSVKSFSSSTVKPVTIPITSQTTTVQPVSVKSTPSVISTKASTVTTMKASTDKVSSIPKATLSKSVASTAEVTTTTTAKPTK